MIKTIKECYCDRCGAKMPEDHSFRCSTYPNTAIEILRAGGWSYADLCDKCKKSFISWWENLPQQDGFRITLTDTKESEDKND